MPTRRTLATFLAVWLFASAAAAEESTASEAQEKDTCIDITPYAINPESLSVLKGGGDIPNDVAVYFDFPAGFGPTIFCLEDILIPNTVGGRDCNEYDACQMAVGKRVHPDDVKKHNEELYSLSDYQCLCNGFSVRPDDPKIIGTAVSGCGISNAENWANSCSDVPLPTRNYYDKNGTEVVSNTSTAYVSLCPPNNDRCGVCSGGGVMPRFVAGIQWVSNIREQCFDDPFGSYKDYYSRSSGGMSTTVSFTSITLAVGVVLFLAVWA